MSNLILHHLCSGTGAVRIDTVEEKRAIAACLREVTQNPALANYDPVEAIVVAAPQDVGRFVRLVDGQLVYGEPCNHGQSLADHYRWAADRELRVVFLLDYHMIGNTALHWRRLSMSLPTIQHPKGSSGIASLVVVVAPSYQMSSDNPLQTSLPVVPFDPPTRDDLAGIVRMFGQEPTPEILDAIAGLDSISAEQVIAETLSASGGRLPPEYLSKARVQAIKRGGLEIWQPVTELGGLNRFQEFVDGELVPWMRDPQLAVRRILLAGVPGVGKSFCAKWLAHRIGCVCARISIPSLKAGRVGESEANLRRVLKTVDIMAKEAPMVVVLDEIDSIPREGLDGGVSSGMFAEVLTWLQESPSQAIVVATLNHLSRLDAALSSRFQVQFFFDLPILDEREAIIKLHLERLGAVDTSIAAALAQRTNQYSSRELAEQVLPTLLRLSNRNPQRDHIQPVLSQIPAAARTHGSQLEEMRKAATTLRKGNTAEGETSERLVHAIENN